MPLVIASSCGSRVVIAYSAMSDASSASSYGPRRDECAALKPRAPGSAAVGVQRDEGLGEVSGRDRRGQDVDGVAALAQHGGDPIRDVEVQLPLVHAAAARA